MDMGAPLGDQAAGPPWDGFGPPLGDADCRAPLGTVFGSRLDDAAASSKKRQEASRTKQQPAASSKRQQAVLAELPAGPEE